MTRLFLFLHVQCILIMPIFLILVHRHHYPSRARFDFWPWCGRDANTCHTQNGDSALIQAAWHGHTVCVRLLLENRADKDAKNNVRSMFDNVSQRF